jgi:hypothetical protein
VVPLVLDVVPDELLPLPEPLLEDVLPPELAPLVAPLELPLAPLVLAPLALVPVVLAEPALTPVVEPAPLELPDEPLPELAPDIDDEDDVDPLALPLPGPPECVMQIIPAAAEQSRPAQQDCAAQDAASAAHSPPDPVPPEEVEEQAASRARTRREARVMEAHLPDPPPARPAQKRRARPAHCVA